MAVGCYTALRKHGLSIPADISVVGLNDIPFSERFDPPLTTIRVPRYEIGRAAAGLLLEQLHRDTPPRRLMISPSLVAPEIHSSSPLTPDSPD